VRFEALARRLQVGILVLASGAALACSTPQQSFIILVLESVNATPITGVAQINLVVSKGTAEVQTLSYAAGDLSIVADADINTGTLSVSFSGTQTGDITFQVNAIDARGCSIGSGNATITIKRGAVSEGIVQLTPQSGCLGDAGTSDGSVGVTFGGCDPAGADTTCTAGSTCVLQCQSTSNACTTAGVGGPGAACQSNSGCAPGSQCFAYSSLGCSTSICLRFCDSDLACGGASDGGTGPGSFCRDPVTCGNIATAYHTCSFSCDPTAAAATNGTGCPAGLACLMPGSDQVDCSCPESTRTGREGAACANAVACAPGFICSAQTCRAICRCDAQSGVCTAPNACPTAGTQCTVVPHQTIYGICL
jgi:hypothetical protein